MEPPAAVFEMAPAKVLHGAVRLHGLKSSPTPETQVLHAPTDIAAAHLALRGRTLDLWAYVISHPAAAAEPSAEDFRSSAFPNALHLVISLSTKGVLEMRAWRLEDGKPREKVLKIRD